MPRKTGYKSKNALSTLVLGNPELGTRAWETEYGIEYNAQLHGEKDKLEESRRTAREKLRTPRSLKKGYVFGEDYEKLDEQYAQTLSAYQDLQLQLGMLEKRLAAMQGNEGLFLRAVEDQHELIDTLRQQVAGLTESLGRLLGGVERNRSLMALMGSVQDAPTAQVATANKMMVEADVARRLTALESKIDDMAGAVAALARSQSLLAAARAAAPPGARQHPGDIRRLSTRGSRGSSERIERLPKPVQLSTLGSLWRP